MEEIGRGWETLRGEYEKEDGGDGDNKTLILSRRSARRRFCVNMKLWSPGPMGEMLQQRSVGCGKEEGEWGKAEGERWEKEYDSGSW
jgi:hypothetical protein